MAKKLTKKNFVSLDPSAIGKLKAPQLREILRGARQLYNAQSSTFKKYSDTVWSPALDKMNDYYDEKGKRNVSRMNMSDMRNEVFRLQEFFDSDTSTVPGARRVMADQDRRIFGTDSKGFHNHRNVITTSTHAGSQCLNRIVCGYFDPAVCRVILQSHCGRDYASTQSWSDFFFIPDTSTF